MKKSNSAIIQTGSIDDPRFKSIHHDPRFIKPSNKKSTGNNHQSETDSRFDLTGKDLKRDLHRNLKSKKHLDLGKSGGSQQIEIPKVVDYARGRVILESSDEDENDDEDEDHQGGSGLEKTSLDSDSDSDSDAEHEVQLGPSSNKSWKMKAAGRRKTDDLNLEIDLNEPESDLDLPEQSTTNELADIQPTKRIAIVNLDWDNIKPIDIFKVFSSLLSPNHATNLDHQSSSKSSSQPKKSNHTPTIFKGNVTRVRFYKSQFGKERMKIEDVEGPPKEIFKSVKNQSKDDEQQDDDDDEDDDTIINEDQGGEFDEAALRKYQLDRLRYFYAIVELNSVQTAQHVFSEIDGTEFERTANIFDLSYVPDDMSFDDEDLWDECTEDSNNYKGVDFSTDVLRHSKVKLTWDSEDPIRKKYTRLNTQKLTQEELDEMDFNKFIAPPSSDEEGEEEEEDVRQLKKPNDPDHSNRPNYQNIRKLLGLSNKPEADQDMQPDDLDIDITFKPGFVNLNQEPDDVSNNDKPSIPETKSTNKKSRNQRIKEKLKLSFVSQGKKDSDQEKHSNGNKASNRAQDEQELDLLLLDDFTTSDNPKNTGLEGQPDPKHFDLTQIMKLEKLTNSKTNKKNKKRMIKKLKNTTIDDEDQLETMDRFAIDANDDRFSKQLVKDPEFAIDPSNPQFKKTKNMVDLLESTRQKRSEAQRERSDYDSNLAPPPLSADLSKPSGGLRSVDQLLQHLKSSSARPPKRQKV